MRLFNRYDLVRLIISVSLIIACFSGAKGTIAAMDTASIELNLTKIVSLR